MFAALENHNLSSCRHFIFGRVRWGKSEVKLNANRNMVKQTAKMAKKSRVRPETRPVLRHWCSSPGEAAKGSENPARVRGHGGCVGVFRQHGVTKRCSSLHTHVAQLWLLLLSWKSFSRWPLNVPTSWSSPMASIVVLSVKSSAASSARDSSSSPWSFSRLVDCVRDAHDCCGKIRNVSVLSLPGW